jgi:phage terminase small subunit
MGKKKRTLREKKFVKAYIENGGNATQAYLAINPEYKGNSAKELGRRMLTKVDLSDDEIMEEIGLTDSYIYEKIKEGTDATKVVSVIPIKPKEAQENNPELPEANSKNVDFVDVEDFPTRHKYIETYLKLRNKYPSEKHELNLKGELEIKDAKRELISRINSVITKTEKTKSSEGN